MRYSELLNALQNLIGYAPTQAELCKKLDIRSNAMANRAGRDSNFTLSELRVLEKSYGVNLIGCSSSDSITLDYIRIAPSCGRGTVVLDEADVTPVRIGKEVIKDIWKVSTPEVLKLFKASGDSMETTIEDGNILLVDTSRTDYHNGGIYVLTINNDWFVKRLRLKINGDLEIISDNPKYEPEILKPNTDIEINVVGRVIKNLSRGL
jgi:hypothetical protein